MKEQFVSSKMAKKLQLLGFGEPCLVGFNKTGYLRSKISSITPGHDQITKDKYDDDIPAPLYQQVINWFREKHYISIAVLPFRDIEEGMIDVTFYCTITELDHEDDILCNESSLGALDRNFDTYKEALDKGINQAINILVKK